MRRVSFDDLAWSDDGYSDVLLDGEPFDGVAFETDPDTGIRSEMAFYLGQKHGPSRSWYPSGALRSEEYFRRGGRHGAWREWSADGRLLHEEIWQYSDPLVRRRWNERGAATEDVNLLDGDAARGHEWLQRRQSRGPLGIIDLAGDELVEKPWPFDDVIPAALRARVAP
jgi:hypothetical protein